jgi:hypothetical protein
MIIVNRLRIMILTSRRRRIVRTLMNAAVLMIVLTACGAARAENESKRAFARWEADGYCYPVKIEKQKEGNVFVRYTDDVTEWAPAWRVGYYTVGVGDEVFGNWKNRGLYYRGKVTKRDGNDIHIQYDDGDEEDTTIDLIRISSFAITPRKSVAPCSAGRRTASGIQARSRKSRTAGT